MFGAEFFAGNRERLRQLFTGTAPIVITASAMVQEATTEPYPFRQDGNFWYLTGLDDPEFLLVMDKGKEYLIVPDRGAWLEASGGVVSFDDIKRRSGVDTVLTEKEGWRVLTSRIRKVRHVATLAASAPYIEVFGMYTNPARAALIKRLKELNEELDLLDLRQHLSRMRMVKQPIELEALQKAIDITVETLSQITRPAKLAKYAHEYEIEADLSHDFRTKGAEGHAFWPIVASGPRTCILHHMINNAPLTDGDVLILDVGARYSHYSADIARTVTLGGKPTRRQRAVRQAVVAAQAHAFSLLKPGTLMSEYEKEMEHFVGEKLRELGLIKSIEHDEVRRFFPHATSHFLGIDTHDTGDYDYPLEAGVVLAVEPGIYISEEGIGVRIEDDVLITPEGCEILSKKLPREL